MKKTNDFDKLLQTAKINKETSKKLESNKENERNAKVTKVKSKQLKEVSRASDTESCDGRLEDSFAKSSHRKNNEVQCKTVYLICVGGAVKGATSARIETSPQN
jgi:hypothetical protein